MAQQKKATAKKPAKAGKAVEKKSPGKKETPKKATPKKASTIKEEKKKEVIKPKQEKVKTAKTEPQSQPVKPATAPAPQTGKKRLLISYDKLPEDVVDIIRNKYPYGYNHDLKEVKGIDNKKFFVLPIELSEVIYLVKVDLRKPFKIEEAEEEDEDIFTPEEGFGGEEGGFPGGELEGVEGEDEDEAPKKKKKKDEDEDDED